MRKEVPRSQRLVFLILSLLVLCAFGSTARAGLWSTGYYPGWEQSGMPASNIDFTALTHIIHFSLVPNANGTLNSSDNSITTANSADIISRAHAAGLKVLICVGGADTETMFQGATTNSNLATFITGLTNFMATRGYDGIDIDWEPLPAADTHQYTNFVIGLRTALSGFSTHKLLTAAVGAYPSDDNPTAQYVMFAGLQNQFDQLNVMTYDLSGPYEGWVTWFNSPIFDGGFRFPSTGGLVPSSDAAIRAFIAGGVASSKLGIGIAFYGDLWTGGTGISPNSITQPRQAWINAPNMTQIAFTTIMSTYYQTNLYHWDTNAQAAYLGITNSPAQNNIFLSYDDQRTCASKVSYARNLKLGGVMIWEIAQDHQKGQPDPLLETVKQAMASPGAITIQPTNQGVALNFSANALGSYRTQWTTNLFGGSWNSLGITNISGPGGTVQVIDPGASNGPQRFYRVITPP